MLLLRINRENRAMITRAYGMKLSELFKESEKG